MAESPITSKIDVPSFEILIDGKEIKEWYPVLSVQVDRDLHSVSKARIILADGDPHEGNFELSEQSDFDPGKEIEVKLGYHSTNSTVFKGVIVRHDIRVRAYSSKVVSELILDCRDKAFKMNVSRKSACFLKKKDSDVIKSVASDYGLSCTCEATTTEHPWLIQHDCTDWDFMNMRAQANGLIVKNEDGKITIEAPALSDAAVLEVSHDIVESFQAGVDATIQVKNGTYEAWDPATQKTLSGASQEPTLNKFGTDKGTDAAKAAGDEEIEYTFSTQDDANTLKSLVNARLLTQRLALFKGHCRFIGSAKVALGQTLTVDGFGKRFNGDLYISGYTHELREGHWSTTVRFGLPSDPYEQQPAYKMKAKTGTGMPDIQGLHIATVQAVAKDPDGAFRVKISLPNLDGDASPIWARLLHPYASDKAGLFFYPELQDEVLVGFLGQDPRNAVILGGLYSKKRQPPFEIPDDTNPNKGIKTPNALSLSFDDKDKVIKIETPAGQVVTLSDKDKSIVLEDQHGNKLSTDDGGITLDSSKDISIKAKGNISMEATGNIEAKSTGNTAIKATGNFEASGMKVDLKAQTSLSAQGTASAELKASGMITVQGAMVKIN